MSVPGKLLDGMQSKAQPVKVFHNGEQWLIVGEETTQSYSDAQVTLELGLPGLPDKLYLPNGSVVEADTGHAFRTLPGKLALGDRVLETLHGSWRMLIALTVLAIITVWTGYRYGIPILSEAAVKHIPISLELKLSEETVALLQSTDEFKPSKLSPQRQAAIRQLLARAIPSQSPYHYQLRFVDSELIGPNAFALPGGTLVMTDALVALAKNDDEIFAVLAHEVAHVEHQHGLRNAMQYLGISVALTLLTGDTSSVLVLAPAVLANTQYSRDFEREADQYAFAQLRKNHLSPCVLGGFLTRLTAATGEEEDASDSWLSTHPSTEERNQVDGQICPKT